MMINSKNHWRRLRSLWIGGVATLPCLMSLSGSASAQELPIFDMPLDAPIAKPAHEVMTLDLQRCVELALQNQPTISAARASLAAAETNRQALDRMRFAALLSRDIPTRRKQAELGVSIAAYGIEQAEHETVYAVTRLYYTVIFAREQKKVAEGVADNLSVTLKAVKAQLDGGARNVTADTVKKVEIYYNLASTKVIDADIGIKRATAALREAIGLGPHCCIKVVEDKFPDISLNICLADMIGAALNRRPEIQVAAILSDVTDLEIKAQGTQWLRRSFRTFASASDIHARPIPTGEANGDYRPGAIGPEMPVSLVGPRSYRTERASDFFTRSMAVSDKTRNLIALETEDVFLKVEQSANKVPVTRSAAERGADLSKSTRDAYTSGGKVAVEDVLTAQVIGAQAQAQYNEARHQLIIALAALERVTAGGFQSGFTSRPCVGD